MPYDLDQITLTPNLGLEKLPANYHVWAQKMNSNLQTIDASIGSFVHINNLQGAWANSTTYNVGDAVVDQDTATIWQCQVLHVSAAIPTTFAQDRTNHPSYWSVYSTSARG